MMNNVSRIQKAILINWKGMFYQPFDIDPGMTILEGANGTGKTTIMIAIYTCLIPDLNFLNFQNVTTVSSRRNEDKGLYGRIGQDSSNRDEPVFSILDIVTSSGTRHLIGVQIIKKTYPHVSLKHFAVNNLSKDVEVDTILLNQDLETNQQIIPEIGEIATNCSKQGADLVQFRHAKDYFQFLFENDISPIRLIENEERRKYNQLLNTSLYGGLSRSLQTSLRDYLLPENDKLVQGIHEMEQNLKTCRRTRSAIQRYQAVREVIQQVYVTGLNLFEASFFATRLDAEQKINQLLNFRSDKRDTKQDWNACLQAIESVVQEKEELTRTLDNKNKELQVANERLNRCLTATKVKKEFEEKEEAFAILQTKENESKSVYEHLKSQRDQLQDKERALGSQQMDLAMQLSDAGQAWQELSKQVGLYHQAEKLLTETRTLLSNQDLQVEDLDAHLDKLKAEVEAARESHQNLFLELSDTQLKQDHFNHYIELLNQLKGEEVAPEDAGKAAEELVEELSQVEKRIQAADKLTAEIGILNEKIANRDRILNALKAAEMEEIQTESGFDEYRDQILMSLKELETKSKELTQNLESANNDLNRLKDQSPKMQKKQNEWDRFQKIKKELEDRLAVEISGIRDLTNLASSFEEKIQLLYLKRYELKSKQKKIQQDYHTLLNDKSHTPGLKQLVDQGFGTLLADRYEEIPADWSANLESRLGPLKDALIVKDIHKASGELTGSFDRPDDLWLVESAFKEKMPEAIEMGDSILVKHGDAWRLSRLPLEPALGKEARAARLEKLEVEIKSIADQLEKNDLEIKSIKDSQTMANRLSLLDGFFAETSPLEQIKTLNQQTEDLEKKIAKEEEQKARLAQQISVLENQEDVLRQFYPIKGLLDETDLIEKRDQQQLEWEEAQNLDSLHKDKFSHLTKLTQGLSVLQQPLDVKLQELKAVEHSQKQDFDDKRKQLELLERLADVKDHFKYKDQVSLLEKEKSINQHTESQLEALKKEISGIKDKITETETELDMAASGFHQQEAELNTLKGQLELLKENLQHAGASGSEKDLDEAKKNHSMLETEKAEIENRLNGLKEKHYHLEAQLKQLEEKRKKMTIQFSNRFNNFRPTIKKWSLFHRKAQADPKFQPLLEKYKSEIADSEKKPEFYRQKAAALRVSLEGKLEKIHDAKSVLDKIKNLSNPEENEETTAENNLEIWQLIQSYIRQVIPVDIQTTDPEKAQIAIGSKLDSLEQNLEQQESSLRIHVQSIPSHLNAEIRKQKSRMRKLNEKLEKVRFGFLQSIRVHLETQSKLKRFLDILPQQLDIFAETSSEDVSIETLMADLYEKEGAGKVKGDLLMDYRHYVRLSIEVKREGNNQFEKVTSTNLSTGESIGVGIAVLMMVLMSWEEQSTLTNDNNSRSSLRFLLLDESSRLDQQALHTLSDFCTRLGLQLLIAAPSVERTLRGTTHHLTRSHFNGIEEVIVRGRRILGDE